MFKKLVHIDAYRLNSGSDLEKIRWQETLSNPDNLIVIEWPEHVQSVLPNDTRYIHFYFIDEETRDLDF